MSGKAGRPITLDHEAILSVIVEHKNQIIENGILVSKTSAIWTIIGEKVNKSGSSLYSYVMNNRNGVKDLLLGTDVQNTEPVSTTVNSERLDSTLETSGDSTLESEILLYISKSEFESLLERKTYNRHERSRAKLRYRTYSVLKANSWQNLISQRLNEKGIKCGFQFKTHKIYPSSDYATFNGICKCGSTLRGNILSLQAEVIKISCYITDSDGPDSCGKRYLRGDRRRDIAKNLVDSGKPSSTYVIEEAERCMEIGDEREPAILPKRTVLNQAKSEYRKTLVVDKDPIKALEILKCQDLKLSIQSIGLNPFYVHYWTGTQLNMYREYSRNTEHPTVFVDATGGLAKKIVRFDSGESGPLFLYNCVVHTGRHEEYNQYSVTQMISESHTTNSILFWLMEWIRTGAPQPHEVVCDSSKALLLACVRAFTKCKTLQEYADSCTYDSVPQCYVRIDVAHIIKMYSNFLKGVHKGVRQIYLASIAKLILAESLNEAKKILKLILIICRSTYQGQDTQCSKAKESLKKLLIRGSSSDTYVTENEEMDRALRHVTKLDEASEGTYDIDDVSEETNDDPITSYTDWGRAIDEEVKENIENYGEDINAHKNERLADKLVKHCSLLPLWTCVTRHEFRFGRIPASSASVESDFNNLKTRIFRGKLPLRVDVFVTEHIKYIQGKQKLIRANQTPGQEVRNDSYSESNIKNSTSSANIQKSTGQNKCFVCLNGDFPTGAHTCIVCSKAVHVIEECSLPLAGEEEGFGERRICVECSAKDKVPEENTNEDCWSGLVGKLPTGNNEEYLPQCDTTNGKQQKPTGQNVCFICLNGDFPTGAHKCIVCSKAVHVVQQCSLPLAGEEEGFGERRICVECSAKDKVPEENTNEDCWSSIVGKLPTGNNEEYLPQCDTTNGKQQELARKTECLICLNGETSTTHNCIICAKPVHIQRDCSLPLPDDEVFGENHICIECSTINKTSIDEIVSSGFKENWKGLVGKLNKKRQQCLQGQMADTLRREKRCKPQVARKTKFSKVLFTENSITRDQKQESKILTSCYSKMVLEKKGKINEPEEIEREGFENDLQCEEINETEILKKNCSVLQAQELTKHHNSQHDEEEYENTEVSSRVMGCFLCEKGDLPIGTPKCIVCFKFVHTIQGCSFFCPDAEEGRESRICMQCSSIENKVFDEVVTTIPIDNVRGAPVEQLSKRSKYILGDFNSNDFEVNSKVNHIPILKNGNVLNLKPVSIGSVKYTLVNTCAFDSLFHLLLVEEIDDSFVKTHHLEKDPFFNLIMKVKNGGVSAYSYKTRAVLLKEDEQSSVSQISESLYEISCTSNIGNLAKNLLKNIPCLSEKSYCEGGCIPTYTKKIIVTIEDYLLNLASESFQAELQERLVQSLGTVPCTNSNCAGFIHTEIGHGHFLLLDVCATSFKPNKMGLQAVLPKLHLPVLSKKVFILKGFINFSYPSHCNKINEGTVGHYTTYVRRPNTLWYEIDDLKKKSKTVRKNVLVQPLLLLYRSVEDMQNQI